MNTNKNLFRGLFFVVSFILVSAETTSAATKAECDAIGKLYASHFSQCPAGTSSGPDYDSNGEIMDSGAVCCNASINSGTNITSDSELYGLNYQLLENIPGTENISGSDLPGYVSAIYRVALIIVTLSAVLMLTIGGFMYLTSAGNTASISNAKGIIADSLIGLIIALSAWLVLYVINPDLVRTSFSSLSPVAGTGSVADEPSDDLPTEGSYTHAEAMSALSAAGIGITSTGSCSDRNNKTCTSLDTIPKSTISNLIALKRSCACGFRVTGGTEVGHKTHGAGKPIVDISEEGKLAAYLRKQLAAGELEKTDKIVRICASKTYAATTSYNCPNFVEANPHFHIQFKP